MAEWIGVFGTVCGALVGGFVSYKVAVSRDNASSKRSKVLLFEEMDVLRSELGDLLKKLTTLYGKVHITRRPLPLEIDDWWLKELFRDGAHCMSCEQRKLFRHLPIALDTIDKALSRMTERDEIALTLNEIQHRQALIETSKLYVLLTTLCAHKDAFKFPCRRDSIEMTRTALLWTNHSAEFIDRIAK